MRKYFMDNIRWMVILLLVPLHTIMVYNGLGVDFPVIQEPSTVVNVIFSIFSQWAMPLFFLYAGCSARYSLDRRSLGRYVRERFTKLLLPLLASLIFVLPTLAYFGEKFQFGYTGSLLDEYVLFFTRTGSTSFDSGTDIVAVLYALSHLWFVLYLLVISFITLPVVALYKKKGITFRLETVPPWAVVVFGGIIYIALDLCLPGVVDKNGVAMVFGFLLGFFCFSQDNVQEWLPKFRLIYLVAAVAIFAAGWGLRVFDLPFSSSTYSWFAMMTVSAYGVQYLNKTNRVFKYFQTASYGFYIFHMTWVVIISYYLITNGASPLVHIAVTIPTAFVATLLNYEIVRRIPGIRFLFALPAPTPREKKS